MSMWTLVIALVSALIVWFLLARQLTARPWLLAGQVGYSADIEPTSKPAKKVALYFLLAAISSLFTLFFTAYIMRMDAHHGGGGDWHTIPKPGILWLNTLLLIGASAAMQWAKSTLSFRGGAYLKTALMIAGVFTLAFLAGQLVAWQELHNIGSLHLSNPALGFFYLLTGVHALHLLGGLYVWARALVRVCLGITTPSINLSVQLCTVYWHYLLLVWLILFGLLLTT